MKNHVDIYFGGVATGSARGTSQPFGRRCETWVLAFLVTFSANASSLELSFRPAESAQSMSIANRIFCATGDLEMDDALQLRIDRWRCRRWNPFTVPQHHGGQGTIAHSLRTRVRLQEQWYRIQHRGINGRLTRLPYFTKH